MKYRARQQQSKLTVSVAQERAELVLSPATVPQRPRVPEPQLHDRQIVLVAQETSVEYVRLEQPGVAVASRVLLLAFVLEGA